jgi:hypothetical protein
MKNARLRELAVLERFLAGLDISVANFTLCDFGIARGSRSAYGKSVLLRRTGIYRRLAADEDHAAFCTKYVESLLSCGPCHCAEPGLAISRQKRS